MSNNNFNPQKPGANFSTFNPPEFCQGVSTQAELAMQKSVSQEQLVMSFDIRGWEIQVPTHRFRITLNLAGELLQGRVRGIRIVEVGGIVADLEVCNLTSN